ncbi:MAG TPA: fertility inhibition FinO-like protein [Cyanobacteria bacterium UBA8553]|nr:fertility inhibition FinO-like protein [Cyanobacteria bacterium UBA8553]HAJ63173.1 fertility inhibition FinO-like protein [Cyanobacteria bacterium UBA8543]
MSTPGKLELTIKINEFPTDVKTVDNGWKEFDLDCDGQVVTIKVRPKVFKKLEQAQENYPMWVAAIAGKMGESTKVGFVLDQPNIQVFERKPKEPKEPQEAETAAAQSS